MDALDDLPEGMGAGQSVAEEGVPPTSQGSEEAAALGPQLSSPKTNEESSVHRHEVEAANEAETAEVAEAAEATEADAEASSNKAESAQAAEAVEADAKVTMQVAPNEAETAEVAEAAEAAEADAEASSNKAESAQAAEAVEADAKVTMQVAPSEAETAEVAEAAEAAEADAEEVELSITEDPAGIELTNDAAEAEEELLFTIDAAGEALMIDSAKSNDGEGLASAAEVPETDEKKPDEETGEAAEADSKPEAACSTCGLFGHDAPACPFAHPEDIDLGDLEESDSDDELAELYPLFSRYVQQHIGALTPKDRKGLTGGGRYFGQEKQQACWACAETGHDANDCPDKGCFFCSKKGHESRDCPHKALRCSHCQLRGHAPVSCPTLATMRLADFSHVRCMRCGILGHPNCGAAPKAPDTQVMPQAPSAQEEADKQRLLQQIAAGRARTRAWDTAPWREKPDLQVPKAKVAKVSKADVPVPDLMICD